MRISVACLQHASIVAVLVAAVAAVGCVDIEYLRPGEAIEPRPDSTVVFTRFRFRDDGREWSPWDPSFVDVMLEIEPHRHFWLRSLDRTAVTAELHPESDGSLAIRLPPGDYALVGTDDDVASETMALRVECVALLRVPRDQAAVYAGDLVLETRYVEGWSARRLWIGEPVVERQPDQAAASAIEARYGALPGPLAVSPWCVGREVPAFNDPGVLDRARQLLDRACPPAP